MSAERCLITTISSMDELPATLPQCLFKPFKSKESLSHVQNTDNSQVGKDFLISAVMSFFFSEEDNRDIIVKLALL